MHCSRCGVPIASSSAFCTQCGNPMHGASCDKQQVMEDHGLPLKTLYEAFLGARKTGYYLPIFERFDRDGSLISWNWPAALITQLWMLRRGMFLWGLVLYPLFSFLAVLLLALPVAFMLGDDFEPWSDSFALVVALALVIVTGLLGNRIFHRHVRAVIAKSGSFGLSDAGRKEWLARKGSSRAGLVVIAILLLTGVAGIIAGIAIPAYGDYLARARVYEGLVAAGQVKAAYAGYLAETGEWPLSMAEIGLAEESAAYGEAVTSITIGPELEIRISLRGGKVDGRSIVLLPSADADAEDGPIAWSCRTQTVPIRYVPAACRQQPADPYRQ